MVRPQASSSSSRDSYVACGPNFNVFYSQESSRNNLSEQIHLSSTFVSSQYSQSQLQLSQQSEANCRILPTPSRAVAASQHQQQNQTDNENNNNNDDETPPKRFFPKSKHHRRRHVPVGPAGVWFESQLHQKAKQQQQELATHNAATATLLVGDASSIVESILPDVTTNNSNTNNSNNNNNTATSTSIKDVSSCLAWQRMQASLGWMTPALSSFSVAERYHWLRPHVPSHMALLPELHGGKYDLCVTAPMVVLVHAVHSHSQHPYDWTVELMDETGDTIRAWMEPKFVQQEQEENEPRYIRPGVCWQLQNVSMTVQEKKTEAMDYLTSAAATGALNTTSTAVERILLIAEHNIVQSWGPGNNSNNSSHHHDDDDDNDDDSPPGRRQRRRRRRQRGASEDVEEQEGPVEPRIRSLHHHQRHAEPSTSPQQEQHPHSPSQDAQPRDRIMARDKVVLDSNTATALITRTEKQASKKHCLSVVAQLLPSPPPPPARLWLDTNPDNESLWDLEDDRESDSENTPASDSLAEIASDDAFANQATALTAATTTQNEQEEFDGVHDITAVKADARKLTQSAGIAPATSALFDVTAMEGMNVDELFHEDDDDDDDC